ncbi:MAG: hypothetical protein IJ140_05360, partial [Prevotella sp.]|nr:hypothetical protein [Prevotella sp.]
MKKLILLSVLVVASSFELRAQDDMYFTPKKKAQGKSTIEKLDNISNDDIIDFAVGNGEYPSDTIDFADSDNECYAYGADDFEDEDFKYTRRMSRFDDFYGWYNPYLYDYYYNYPYWRTGFYSWYDPWAYRWYDPWYYTYNWGYYGWGWPYYGWYYPYHNWYYPYYGGSWYAYGGHT